MGVLESVKEKIEKVTGWKRPSRGDLRDAVRSRKPNSFRFKDDGIVPNNPKLPFILYRSPVSLADDFDPAAVFEELFARNGWGDSWRNGIAITCTITRALTKCSGSRAAMPGFASAASAEKRFTSRPAMWRSCRPEPATSDSPPARTCWWSAHIRPSAVTTNAAPARPTTIAP